MPDETKLEKLPDVSCPFECQRNGFTRTESGLLNIKLAKLKGAKVIATDIDDYRLQKAKEYGADEVLAVVDPDKSYRMFKPNAEDNILKRLGIFSIPPILENYLKW